jgi:glycerophosphoryl diester phosphodiesterase
MSAMGTSRRVWNVAHRGASAERPENTLPAFELAIEQRADVVECDVRATADGALLLMHDATVDRTTSGSGELRAMTAAQAADLDAGDGQRVPALADVLRLAAGRVRVNVDLKEADIVDDAVAQVREAGAEGSVTYISFLPEVWQRLDELAPQSPVIHLVDSAAALASIAMGDAGSQGVGTGVGVPFDIVNEGVVERMHRHGHGVFAWTVDDEDEMRRLIACDVNGIVTNRPAALAEVIRDLQTSVVRG